MTTKPLPYYVTRVDQAQAIADSYDMRQTRFRHLVDAGRPHPHDLMAVGFTAEGMRALVARNFPDQVDMTVLPDPVPDPAWTVTGHDPCGGPDFIIPARSPADAEAQRITLEAYGFQPVTVTRKD